MALLSTLCYAGSGVCLKRGMQVRAGDDGLLVSLFLNVLMYSGFYLFSPGGMAVPWSRTGILAFVGAGALTSLLARWAYFGGIRRLGPSRAVALKSSSPVFAFLAALLVPGEEVRSVALLGAVLVVAGVWAVTGNHRAGTPLGAAPGGRQERTGMLMALVAAAAYGGGHVLRKVGINATPDPVAGALIGAVTGLAVYLALAAFSGRLVATLERTRQALTPSYLLAGILVGLGQVLFFYAAQFTGITHVAVISASEPVLTIGLSSLFLPADEQRTPFLLAGVGMVTAGAAVLVLVR